MATEYTVEIEDRAEPGTDHVYCVQLNGKQIGPSFGSRAEGWAWVSHQEELSAHFAHGPRA